MTEFDSFTWSFSLFLVGSIECKFYDSTGTQQCHGAEGQQLHFHLSKTKIIDFRLTKNGEYILLITYSNGKVDLKGQYVSQFEEIRPGTFSLGNAMKEHSGNYCLQEYDAAGQEMRNVQVHVKIQSRLIMIILNILYFGD